MEACSLHLYSEHTKAVLPLICYQRIQWPQEQRAVRVRNELGPRARMFWSCGLQHRAFTLLYMLEFLGCFNRPGALSPAEMLYNRADARDHHRFGTFVHNSFVLSRLMPAFCAPEPFAH